MNKTFKIISTVLIAFSVAAGIIMLIEGLSDIFYYGFSMMLIPSISRILLIASDILLLIGMWKEEKKLSSISFILFIVYGGLTLLEYLLLVYEYGLNGIMSPIVIGYYIGSALMIVTAVLLLVSYRKKNIVCAAIACFTAIFISMFFYKLVIFVTTYIVAGILFCFDNKFADKRKAKTVPLRQSIWGDMSMLKSLLDEGVITEEEYTKRKTELLNEF